MLMFSSLLLTADQVVKMSKEAQTAYLLCIWTAAYKGVVAVCTFAVAVAVVLIDDAARNTSEETSLVLPLAVQGALWVPEVLAVLVLQHVNAHLLPINLQNAAAAAASSSTR